MPSVRSCRFGVKGELILHRSAPWWSAARRRWRTRSVDPQGRTGARIRARRRGSTPGPRTWVMVRSERAESAGRPAMSDHRGSHPSGSIAGARMKMPAPANRAGGGGSALRGDRGSMAAFTVIARMQQMAVEAAAVAGLSQDHTSIRRSFAVDRSRGWSSRYPLRGRFKGSSRGSVIDVGEHGCNRPRHPERRGRRNRASVPVLTVPAAPERALFEVDARLRQVRYLSPGDPAAPLCFGARTVS